MEHRPQFPDDDHRLIRRYSKDTRVDMANESLSQGLASKVDMDLALDNTLTDQIFGDLFGSDGTKLVNFDPSPLTTRLDTKRDELQRTWTKFAEKLKVKGNDDVGIGKPNLGAIRTAIHQAENKLQRRRGSTVGNVKSFLIKTAQSVETHGYLFELLPKGDRYASVFTGSFTTIINATVTHENIADELAEGFDSISDQVRTFYLAIRAHPDSNYINFNIAEFYFELFDLLIKLMQDWYSSSWKRFSKSLGDTFLENVQKSLRKLEKCTERIKTEEGRRNTELIIKGLMRLGCFMQDALVGLEKRHIARINQLKGEQSTCRVESVQIMSQPANTTELITYPDKIDKSTVTAPEKLTLENIQAKIQNLIGYAQDSKLIARLLDESQYIAIGQNISMKIRQWSTSLTSNGLWIEGPYDSEWPSHSALTSAFVLGTLQRLQLPTMVYFLRYDASQYKTFSPDKELVNLIYSLIYQASQNLTKVSSESQREISMNAAPFDQLDGEIGSLSVAIDLLKELLSVGEALQFCIIDGIQVLEGKRSSKDGARYLDELLSLLGGVSTIGSKGSMIKSLFSTNGMTDGLAKLANTGLLLREFDEVEDEDDSNGLDLSGLTE